MRAIELRTEYLNQPLGIDIIQPRFFWKCEGGVKQTAYQIVAKKDHQIVWDSGKVISDRMTHITYEGPSLVSRDCIEWTVVLWDEHDFPGEATTAWFEMGLLQATDWKAKWISGNYQPRKHERYSIDYFKKNFSVKKDIKQARLYITAMGLYTAYLNGERIGDFELAPGCTDYRHRIQYQTYDIESLLDSDNKFEIQLADGWYRGSIGCFGPTNVFGRQTKVLAQIEIVYTDGTYEYVVTDDRFSWSNDGPIQFADLKDGEIVDNRLKASYQDTAQMVEESMVPTASNNVAIRKQEEFTAEVVKTSSGKTILDFGQNIAGFISFSLKAKMGQTLKMRLGEILDSNGDLTQENFQKKKPAKEFGTVKKLLMITGNEEKLWGETALTPKQEVLFTCREGDNHYTTQFAIFGFRYVEIESDIPIEANQFKAIAVYSDMEHAGDFDCSNGKINQFLANTRWSMKGNFADVPTDCPTRERLGWTGDGQVFFQTAGYLMNIAPFYRKWLHDFSDGQFENGKNSAVVPYAGMEMLYNNTGGSVGWADAIVLIPYRFWKWYDDEAIIKQFYPEMKKYADYLIANTGFKDKKMARNNLLNQYVYEKGFHLGEWLEPEEFRPDPRARIKHTEICTAYLHKTMTCMAEIARTLQKEEDYQLYHEYSEGSKRAYQQLFMTNKHFDTDRQASFVRPLAFHLVEGEQKAEVAKKLVEKITARNYRVGTGFLSTPFLLTVLSDNGYEDAAYRMLENEESPSWLAQVNAGATTVWEDWEGKESHNHYSPGAVCEWLFHTVGGIHIKGRNSFKIEPKFGSQLSYAKTSLNSLYGYVSTEWKKRENSYELKVTIPANTTADIILNDEFIETVEAGVYNYVI